MTQTDYVKERLAFLKIALTGIVGAILALGVYNVQSSGSNFINAMASLIILIIPLVWLGKKYKKLLSELKDLP